MPRPEEFFKVESGRTRRLVSNDRNRSHARRKRDIPTFFPVTHDHFLHINALHSFPLLFLLLLLPTVIFIARLTVVISIIGVWVVIVKRALPSIPPYPGLRPQSHACGTLLFLCWLSLLFVTIITLRRLEKIPRGPISRVSALVIAFPIAAEKWSDRFMTMLSGVLACTTSCLPVPLIHAQCTPTLSYLV